MSINGDYSKCKIYKLISLGNPELVYYGHTIQKLCQRFSKHKSSPDTYSKQIIDKGDAIIELVEDYPCDNVMQARLKEAQYILNNECVNKNIPGRSIQETNKFYYNKNNGQILEQKKIYYIDNKEFINDKKKIYFESNKDAINARRRENYKLKKEQINIIN